MEDTRSTILIVDDQPENLEVPTGILKVDYQVRAVGSGLGAFRAAGLEPRPDLILLDIMMPGLDGFQTMGQIKYA